MVLVAVYLDFSMYVINHAFPNQKKISGRNIDLLQISLKGANPKYVNFGPFLKVNLTSII